MKPYGREKTVKGGNSWKKDYHCHSKNRKLKNWWEGICQCISRTTMKQRLKKEIDKLD